MVLLAIPALGQTPYQVESDELEIYNKQGKAIFTGNVKIWNDTGQITARRVEVFYEEGGDTVRLMEAYGNVEITRQNMFARSEFAQFDVLSDTVVLQKDAYVRRGKNEFWAEWIWANIQTQEVRLKNNVRGTLVGSEGDQAFEP